MAPRAKVAPTLFERARALPGDWRILIPVLILLDQNGSCRGWWGPRPRVLQTWFEAEGRPLPKEERYREIRKWYARDRGASIAQEIVDRVACVASPAGAGFEGACRPCADTLAA